MKHLYLILRSTVLWLVSWLHFVPGVLLLLLVNAFADARKTDPLQRLFARNIMRLAGVRLRVEASSQFDPSRTSIFISNHVNLFDPFVLYSTIPQFFRGWELESHFKIPVYGWLMKRFANIPVPDQKTPGSLRRLIQRTREALDGGTSLIVFPEGKRTRDGHVLPFQPGIFRIVRDLGLPIVPVSMVGSYEFNHKGSYLLKPSTITVYLHPTIETKDMTSPDREALCNRVQQIVAAPVEANMQAVGKS